jgi:WD40 repeat protein
MELENYIEAAAAYSGVLKVDAKNKEALEGAQRARELDASKRKKDEDRLRLQLDANRREAEDARKKADEESRKVEEAQTEEDRQRAIRLKAEAEERARLAEAAARKVDEQIRMKSTVKPTVPPPMENAWAGSTNLLSMVGLPAGIVWGTWSVQDNKLLSDRENFARVEVPYTPPEEYDVRLVFSRISGSGAVALILPASGGRSLSVELGGWLNTSNGFQSYRGVRRPDHFGATTSPRALENRRVYTLDVQVRKESVSATLDGRPFLPGSGQVELVDLTLDACWALRTSGGIGLGSNASPAEFHRLDLLAVSGKGGMSIAPAPPVFKARRVGARALKPGLVGNYYLGTNFEIPAFAQVDPAPAFSWNTGAAWKGGPVDAFSVRWTGYLLVPKRGRYSFSLASDDGSRLFIDDVQVISNWKVNPEPARSPFLAFEEGYHKVTVEYFEDAYNASVAIFWTDSTEGAPSPVPTRQCFHDPADLKPPAPPKFPEAVAVFPPHGNFVTAAAFSPDAKFVVTASEDKKAKVWNAASQRELYPLVGHAQGLLCAAFSPDGKLIATGGWDNRIRLWDPASGQELKTLEGHAGYVGSLAFSPNGKTLASGSFDRTVKVWDVAERSPLKTLAGHAASVEGLAFSPDGNTLASASLDHTVRLWEMSEGRETRVLAGHADFVQGVAFSPNGATLASCGWDGLIKLWDPATGREKATLTGHSSEVMSVAFSPDGKLLVSGGNDSMIRVWDAVTGKEIRVLAGHTRRVMGVSFAREGRLLVSASFDMTARVWDLRSW